MTSRIESFPVVALTACVLGLLTYPLVYVATGALFQFSPVFSVIVLLPSLAGTGFLLARYLARPAEPPRRRVPLLVLEGAAWIAIATFSFLVSSANLMRGFERLGFACAAFLVAAAVWLPVVLLRRTALQRRLAVLPKAVAISALLLAVGAASAAAIFHLMTPPAFIG